MISVNRNGALKVFRNYALLNEFESFWTAGTSAAPYGYTLTGAGATVAKDTVNKKWGLASVKLTRVGNDAKLTQDIAAALDATGAAIYGPVASWAGTSVSLACEVFCATGNVARLALFDGVNRTFSAYHPGDGQFHTLFVDLTVDPTAPTVIQFELIVDTTNAAASFDRPTLIPGAGLTFTLPSSWTPRKCALPFSTGAAVAQNQTLFLGPSANSVTEAIVRIPVPYAGVVRRLYVTTDVNVGGTTQTVITNVRKNSVDTSPNVTTTINTGAAAGNDQTNEALFSVGDQMDLKTVLSATTGTLAVKGAVEYEEVPTGI